MIPIFLDLPDNPAWAILTVASKYLEAANDETYSKPVRF